MVAIHSGQVPTAGLLGFPYLEEAGPTDLQSSSETAFARKASMGWKVAQAT